MGPWMAQGRTQAPGRHREGTQGPWKARGGDAGSLDGTGRDAKGCGIGDQLAGGMDGGPVEGGGSQLPSVPILLLEGP